MELGGVWWTNVLNSALPPQRHRSDTRWSTKILSATRLRRKGKKKERERKGGREGGRKEGALKTILKKKQNKNGETEP